MNRNRVPQSVAADSPKFLAELLSGFIDFKVGKT